jgi:L-threonylcarbamoyladenylate synthase
LANSPKIIRIDAIQPQQDRIDVAAGIIQQGGVVVCPTTCLYGLGADALNEDAVQRLYAIKQRPQAKPILVLIHDLTQLSALTAHIPMAARQLMDNFWPGQVTLVFKARQSLSSQLTGGSGKIGVRLARHPVTVQLLEAVNRPLTGTSANLSGQPGCAAIAELDSTVVESVDLVLDAGRLQGGRGSTVVDVTADPPVVMREGAVAATRIASALTGAGKKIDK